MSDIPEPWFPRETEEVEYLPLSRRQPLGTPPKTTPVRPAPVPWATSTEGSVGGEVFFLEQLAVKVKNQKSEMTACWWAHLDRGVVFELNATVLRI